MLSQPQHDRDVASFVHRDLSDWLVHGALRNSSAASKLWFGQVLRRWRSSLA